MKVLTALRYSKHPITDFLPFELNQDYGRDDRHLDPILWLITQMHNGFLTHNHTNCIDCIYISQDMLTSLFTESQWYKVKNNISTNKDHPFHKLFEIQYNGSSGQGTNQAFYSAYRASKLLQNAYLNWFRANIHTDFYEYYKGYNKPISKGKRRKSPDVFLNKKDKVKFLEEDTTDYNISEIVEVDTSKADSYLLEQLTNNTKLETKDINKLLRLKHIIAYVKNNNNQLEIRYKTADSGRFYSVGFNNILAIRKEARKALFHNYHEYDIESAAPLLLAQEYKKITGDERVPLSIGAFIRNKKIIREEFALKYDISLEESKRFFTSLFFGAEAQPWDEKEKTSLTKTVSIKNIKSIINQKGYIYRILKETKLLFKTIAKHHKRKNKNGDYEDIVGHGNNILKPDSMKTKKGIKRWSDKKVTAHIYQSIESEILKTMIEYYTTTTKDRNYIRVHDCMYTKEPIDTSKLYKYIKSKTGYDTLFKRPVSKEWSREDIRILLNAVNTYTD